MRDNPGRQGTTTGRTRQAGTFTLVQVNFGPGDTQYKRYNLLEPIENEEDLHDMLRAGRFGGPTDLRRVLALEKIRGELTNVFYSMEASNTQFFAHQFKPVLKFVESSVGRLLIADEVGLGKTIEAIYIWKELQAREDARRLLIIVPAMLRNKWRADLRHRFNIDPEIVGAQKLLERLQFSSHYTQGFVLISSLEGLRSPDNFNDPSNQSPRARLARLFDDHSGGDSLFDLVVIDEAHYLRNPETASNRLGRLVRDASRNLILLTATPVQTDSMNLFQLLHLIDPDQFFQQDAFAEVLNANTPIVRSLRDLWSVPPNYASAADSLSEARQSEYFQHDSVIAKIEQQIRDEPSDELRVELSVLLESRLLLGQYMTRSRKRQVLKRRVERAAQVMRVRFHPLEKAIYKEITSRIRSQAANSEGASLFVLCMRQRQMASSLVAALRSWRDRDMLEELAWEDLGTGASLGGRFADVDVGTYETDDFETKVSELESVDSKYRALLKFIRERCTGPRAEKVVIFSFFRGTLHYLSRRLSEDGVQAVVIMGGMGSAQDDVLRAFRSPDGPLILLSSEVGSEGIDLQFCRLLVNYDLPWNPMKVEQRIGRIDRLGQVADRISIVNFAVVDTVEDEIVLRMYDRIQIFRDSIGDLEEILGETTESLMIRLLSPDLTDEERRRIAHESEIAVLNRRREQERLESNAVNLTGFTDFILNAIEESKRQRRWLSGEELLSFVGDFFSLRYPGTVVRISSTDPLLAEIALSHEARTSLTEFINERRAYGTQLHRSVASRSCHFDTRRAHSITQHELIGATHPLIQWIRSVYDRDDITLHAVTATVLSARLTSVPSGMYAVVVHRWAFSGLRNEGVLRYGAVELDGARLTRSDAESLIVTAALSGTRWPNARLTVPIDDLRDAIDATEQMLNDEFADRLYEFELQNTQRCNIQETSGRRFSNRRTSELRGRIARFQNEGRKELVPMTEGLLRKEESQLATKLDVIRRRRTADGTLAPLCAGVIRVVC